MEQEMIALVQWLVNQGAGVAIALLVLWRLDSRLAKLTETQAKLTEALLGVTEFLRRQNGHVPTPAESLPRIIP